MMKGTGKVALPPHGGGTSHDYAGLAVDAADTAEHECAICFELLDDVAEHGVLPECNHEFCFDCIHLWARTENRCPFCRKRFHHISKVDKTEQQKSGKARRRGAKVKVQTRDQVGSVVPPSTVPSYFPSFGMSRFGPDDSFPAFLLGLGGMGGQYDGTLPPHARGPPSFTVSSAPPYGGQVVPSHHGVASTSSSAAAVGDNHSSSSASTSRRSSSARAMNEWLRQSRRERSGPPHGPGASAAAAAGQARGDGDASSSTSSPSHVSTRTRLRRGALASASVPGASGFDLSNPPSSTPMARGSATTSNSGTSPDIQSLIDFTRRIRASRMSASTSSTTASVPSHGTRPSLTFVDNDDEVEVVATIPAPPAAAVGTGQHDWDMDLTAYGASGGGARAIEVDLTPPSLNTRRRRRSLGFSRSGSDVSVVGVGGASASAEPMEVVVLDDDDDSPSRRRSARKRSRTQW